ncbi:MAG: hypothetical protein SVP26_00070 [Chloroflexota bacterium]|nr:hypothetical protein [Chloroflexota bacterium]
MVTGLAERFGPLPKMRIKEIGYGVGARELKEICRPPWPKWSNGRPVGTAGAPTARTSSSPAHTERSKRAPPTERGVTLPLSVLASCTPAPLQALRGGRRS